MQIIAHRRNTLAGLKATPPEYGVETDIRSSGSELVLHHDPFARGERFADWLTGFCHKTLVCNVKEEGLEEAVTELLRRRGIEDFFFLDQSFPFLVKSARQGEKRCAVRVSEFESVDTALSLSGQVDWVWVDCFTRFPLDAEAAQRLCGAGFRLCLVSPELQGRDARTEVPILRSRLRSEGIAAAAVCTKNPELWR
ncbi:MAG: hypothetical protein LBO64_09075 [Desulfovibrio sp.]|jgi:hypothetical protein|nr:hypothetical protein [Desulfovibrio sp.]